MPSPAALVAVVALGVAAATSVVRCLRDAGAFDAGTIGEDAASAARRRFAALRAELPPATAVHVVVDERDLSPAELAVFDVCAAALHQRLTTGANDAVLGVDDDYVRQIAEGFVLAYPPEQNRDLAAVRANLITWFTQLAGGLHHGLLQFGLAPHRLRYGSPTPWVVGAFSPGFDWRPLAARRRLSLVTDHGDGVVLFRAEK